MPRLESTSRQIFTVVGLWGMMSAVPTLNLGILTSTIEHWPKGRVGRRADGDSKSRAGAGNLAAAES